MHSMQKFVFDNKLDKRSILNSDNHARIPPTPITIPITAVDAIVCRDGVGYTTNYLVGGGPRVNSNVILRDSSFTNLIPSTLGEANGSLCVLRTELSMDRLDVIILPFGHLGLGGFPGRLVPINISPSNLRGFVVSDYKYSVVVISTTSLWIYLGQGKSKSVSVACNTAEITETGIVIRQSNSIRFLDDTYTLGDAATFGSAVGTLGKMIYVNGQVIVVDGTTLWVSDAWDGSSPLAFNTKIQVGYIIDDIKRSGSHILIDGGSAMFLFRQSGLEWVYVWSTEVATGSISLIDIGKKGYDSGRLTIGNFHNNTLSVWESGYNPPYSESALTGTNIILTDGISRITATDGVGLTITLPMQGVWVHIQISGTPSVINIREYKSSGGAISIVDTFTSTPSQADPKFTFVRKTTTASSEWMLAGSSNVTNVIAI